MDPKTASKSKKSNPSLKKKRKRKCNKSMKIQRKAKREKKRAMIVASLMIKLKKKLKPYTKI